MKPQAIAAGVVALVLMLTPFAFSAQLNFTPVFTVSEEYNDNIFRAPDDEEDDFITRTTFGGTLELLGRTSGAELTYLPSYEWYDDFSEFDGWTHDLSGRLWHEFTANTRLELSNGFIRTRGSIENRDFTAATTDDPLEAPEIEADRLRQGLDEYYTNSTTLRLDHRFGAEDRIYTAFNYKFRRDVDDGTDENDIWSPSVGLTYWFTNFWGVQTDLSYTNQDEKEGEDREQWNGRLRLSHRITRHLAAYGQYEHTILDFDGPDNDDYEVYQPTAGINYQLDQNTRIDIGAGWYYQDFDNGGSDDGFVLNALADKVWPFRRGLVGVTLLSGTDVDDEGVEDLGFRRYAALTTRAQYAFTPRFNGNVSVGYRLDDYPDQDPERTDNTIFAAAGLQYQALRWMFLNLDYTFSDLSTDDEYEDDEYTENRVILSITLTPEQPFRLFR